MNNETKISQSIQAHKLHAEARKNAETAYFYNILMNGLIVFVLGSTGGFAFLIALFS